MTDRFKFRVWDKKSKIFIERGLIDIYLGVFSTDNLLNKSRFLIEQCTGLKDKNGKLIYENDVVKDTIIESGVIEWNEYHACFMVVFNDGDNREFGEWDTKDFEIIGNIHENCDWKDSLIEREQ